MFLLLHTRRTLVNFTQNPSLLHKPTLYLSPLHYFTSKSIVAPSSSLVSDFLTQKHHISPQVALRAASALSHLRSTENSDSVISFLKDYGFSQTQLEKFIQKVPQLLSASLDQTIKPKFKFFQEFGFSDSEIAGILSKNPWILKRSLSDTLAPSLPVLKGLLGSNAQVAKLLMISGSYLDLEKTLVPNIDYLTSCGVEMDQIRRFLRGYWRFFLLEPEVMKQGVERADRLGADRSSGMFLRAVKVVGSMSEEIWEHKLQGFRELGFAEDDILMMFRKAPIVFAGSLEKVKKIKEILLATGKYTMKSIISNPTSLMGSVEKRYKPRLSVLEVLESKKLIQEWPGLSKLYTMKNDEFYKGYVAPHLKLISEVLLKAAIR